MEGIWSIRTTYDTLSLPVYQWTGEDCEDLKEGKVTKWKESGSLHDSMAPIS